MARAVSQREWPERFGERVAHPRLRRLDQDGTDVNAFARHHPARRALQHFRIGVCQLLVRDAFPIFVRARSLLLRADSKQRKNFQTRLDETERADAIEK